MLQHLERAERTRLSVTPHISQKRKAEFGQFMTPSSVARFMASLFPHSIQQTCRLLDAGAGMGALTCAFLDRWGGGGFGFQSVEAFAYEIDESLRGFEPELQSHADDHDTIMHLDYGRIRVAESV